MTQNQNSSQKHCHLFSNYKNALDIDAFTHVASSPSSANFSFVCYFLSEFSNSLFLLSFGFLSFSSVRTIFVDFPCFIRFVFSTFLHSISVEIFTFRCKLEFGVHPWYPVIQLIYICVLFLFYSYAFCFIYYVFCFVLYSY